MSKINLIKGLSGDVSVNGSDEPIMIYLIALDRDGQRWYLKEADHTNQKAMKWTQDVYSAFYMYTEKAMEACVQAYEQLAKRKDIFIVQFETTVGNLYNN